MHLDITTVQERGRALWKSKHIVQEKYSNISNKFLNISQCSNTKARGSNLEKLTMLFSL